MENTQTFALQAAYPVELQPPFGVGEEPAQLSAAVPHLLQQTRKPLIDMSSQKILETSDGSESQQGQQVVQPLQVNPRITTARFDPFLGQLTKVCMQF